MRDLLELGVPFDRTADGELALSLEAAHSRARVARVSGDLAGKAIMEALTYAVSASAHIEVIERVKALALLQDANGRIGGVLAQETARRACSSCARARPSCARAAPAGSTPSPPTRKSSQGDALAMAYTAGALIADPEFVQFHPTAIDIGRDPAPLATEALRGEGAHLVDAKGRAFMTDYHTLGDLAPRDEVARAIHSEREAGRGAFLDCRKAIGAHFPDHFPTVFEACRSAGIDPRDAAHPGRARRCTTTWAASSRTCGRAPRSKACRPAARAPRPARMAPTASPRTRCSKPSCSPSAPRAG